MKKGYKIFLGWMLALLNLIAVAALVAGLTLGARSGYTQEMWGDILRGKSWLESAQYGQMAADSVYRALEVAARSSRLEQGGEYTPERVIRLRDYLNSRVVYDTIPENQKSDGICYRLGDLYQWSLKGTNVYNNILQEPCRPLFYQSIQ